MNKNYIFGIGIVLAMLVVLTAPAAADAEVWFSNPNDPNVPGEPLNANVSPGENVTIQIMWYVDTNESGAKLFQVGVDFDRSVVNITNVTNPIKVPGWGPYPPIYWWDDVHQYRYVDNDTYDNDIDPPLGAYVWLIGANDDCHEAPITVPIANLTIEGVSGGTTALNFTHEIRRDPTVALSQLFDCAGDDILEDNLSWYNSEIECMGPSETFTKDLSAGWNLISLPLTPENNSTSAVLGNDTMEYDATYRYNATSNKFEDVTTGTMDPGIGYFVNVTTAGTWSYNGTAYTSMNISLQPGLNMIGWLNCSKGIDDALSSIAGNYRYVASWNATAHKFEVYNPGAPAVFNDFTTMDQGVGYFISMKEEATLIEGC